MLYHCLLVLALCTLPAPRPCRWVTGIFMGLVCGAATVAAVRGVRPWQLHTPDLPPPLAPPASCSHTAARHAPAAAQLQPARLSTDLQRNGRPPQLVVSAPPRFQPDAPLRPLLPLLSLGQIIVSWSTYTIFGD